MLILSPTSGCSEGSLVGRLLKYAPLHKAQKKPSHAKICISELQNDYPITGDLILVCTCNRDALESDFTLVKVIGVSNTPNHFVGVNKFTDKVSKYPNTGSVPNTDKTFNYYAVSYLHGIDPFKEIGNDD